MRKGIKNSAKAAKVKTREKSRWASQSCFQVLPTDSTAGELGNLLGAELETGGSHGKKLTDYNGD